MKSSIHRFIIPHLEHQHDRKSFMLGNLLSSGISPAQIDFQPAKFWRDYGSKADTKEAAKADGFEFFRDNWRADDVGEWYSICIAWSYCRALRDISKGEKAMIILSDILLSCPLDMLSDAVAGIGDFDAIQLVRGSFDSCPTQLTVLPGFFDNTDFGTIYTYEGAKRMTTELSVQPWAGFAELSRQLSERHESRLYHVKESVVSEASRNLLSQETTRDEDY